MIVLRSVRLDLTWHDSVNNKAMENTMANISFFIFIFLPVPPMFLFIKRVCFTICFTIYVDIKDKSLMLDYNNETFILQGFEIDNISGRISVEILQYAEKYPYFTAIHVVCKSNNNGRFSEIILQTDFHPGRHRKYPASMYYSIDKQGQNR